jgi:hypothetical protein
MTMRTQLAMLLCGLVLAVPAGTLPGPAQADPRLHRGCTNKLLGHYYVGVGHVRCRFAIRSARWMIRAGAKPRSWRCDLRAAPTFGTCKSRGRIFHWAGAE